MGSGIKLAVVIASLITGVACSPALDRCFGTDSPLHTASLAREFDAQEFDYRIESGNIMCVDEGFWLETDRVRARVHMYRNSAVDLVISPEHRQHLVATLDQLGKEYRIATTDRGDELVTVFSGSEQELAENKALLEVLR